MIVREIVRLFNGGGTVPYESWNRFLYSSHRTVTPSRNLAMDSPAGSLPATAASMMSGQGG